MKGCPDVVVVGLVAGLILVVCGLPNIFPNCDPLVDDAITLLPRLLVVALEANRLAKFCALVTGRERYSKSNTILYILAYHLAG